MIFWVESKCPWSNGSAKKNNRRTLPWIELPTHDVGIRGERYSQYATHSQCQWSDYYFISLHIKRQSKVVTLSYVKNCVVRSNQLLYNSVCNTYRSRCRNFIKSDINIYLKKPQNKKEGILGLGVGWGWGGINVSKMLVNSNVIGITVVIY